MTDRPWFVFGGLPCGTLLAATLLAIPAIAQQRSLTEVSATAYRGKEGKRITVVCVPKAEPGRIWGTDVYSDDSSICGAAVHAGVISAAEGGAVTAVITGGRPSFTGSERNGVTSRSFDEYPGSFTVEKGDGGEIDWSTRAAGLERARGSVALTCPPTESIAVSTVWGSDIYSDDTAICAAAVHAGVITPARGGRVVIEPAAGRTSYRGTSRNGVRSLNYGSWPKSFRFEGMVAEAAPTKPVSVAPANTGASQSIAAPRTLSQSGPSATASDNYRSDVIRATPPRTAAESPRSGDPLAVHATNLRAVAGPGKIVLTWTAAPGAVGYRLARGSWDAAKQAFVQSAAANIPDKPADEPGGLITGSTYDDASVASGTQYVYWLDTYFRSASGALYSAPPGEPYPTVTVTSREPAASPTNLKAVSGSRFVYLTWNATPGALGYVVRRSDGGNTVTLNDRLPNTDSLAPNPFFVDTRAEIRPYVYRVAAVYADANGTRYSSGIAQAPHVSAVPRADPDEVTGLKVTGFALRPTGFKSCSLCADGEYRAVYLQWSSHFDAGWSVAPPFNELGIVAMEVWDPTAGWSAITREIVLSRQDSYGVPMESLLTGLEKESWNRPGDPPICYVVTDESVPLKTRVARVRVTFYQYNGAHEHVGKPTRSVYSRPASFTARIHGPTSHC